MATFFVPLSHKHEMEIRKPISVIMDNRIGIQ
jgi:hypothetical protein